jgi:hypothetical protein
VSARQLDLIENEAEPSPGTNVARRFRYTSGDPVPTRSSSQAAVSTD